MTERVDAFVMLGSVNFVKEVGRNECSLMTNMTAVSMGGSNEFVECFCGGAVAEGGSGGSC